MFEDFLEYRDNELYWKVSKGRAKKGSLAGTITTNGCGHYYRSIRFNGRAYMAHRIIWELCVGEIPEGMVIDHINGDTLDNSLGNLRVCTVTQNAQNIHHGRGMYSSYKGVSFDKRKDKFVTHIRINGVSKTIGYYSTELEAGQAYAAVAREAFGEYANTGGLL